MEFVLKYLNISIHFCGFRIRLHICCHVPVEFIPTDFLMFQMEDHRDTDLEYKHMMVYLSFFVYSITVFWTDIIRPGLSIAVMLFKVKIGFILVLVIHLTISILPVSTSGCF